MHNRRQGQTMAAARGVGVGFLLFDPRSGRIVGSNANISPSVVGRFDASCLTAPSGVPNPSNYALEAPKRYFSTVPILGSRGSKLPCTHGVLRDGTNNEASQGHERFSLDYFGLGLVFRVQHLVPGRIDSCELASAYLVSQGLSPKTFSPRRS